MTICNCRGERDAGLSKYSSISFLAKELLLLELEEPFVGACKEISALSLTIDAFFEAASKIIEILFANDALSKPAMMLMAGHIFATVVSSMLRNIGVMIFVAAVAVVRNEASCVIPSIISMEVCPYISKLRDSWCLMMLGRSLITKFDRSDGDALETVSRRDRRGRPPGFFDGRG